MTTKVQIINSKNVKMTINQGKKASNENNGVLQNQKINKKLQGPRGKNQ